MYVPPGVGDVPWASRTYDNGANLLCYTGTNHCGPDAAWAEGGVHGRDLVITTGPDGSSGCCAGFPWRMGGGLGLGGSAKPAPRQQRAIGGLGLGGSAIMPGRQQVGLGGLGLGGWARQTGALPFFGGLGLGGSAYQLGGTQSMLGGLGLGGSAYQLGGTQSMLGGLGLGGEGAQAGGGYIIVSIPSYPFYAIIQGGDRLQSMTGGLGLGGEASQESDQLYVGEYRWMSDLSPPAGWLICDGTTFSSVTYPALATLLGDRFGVHSGTNYYLPNMEGRSLLAPNPTGSGGMSVRNPGQTGGVESVTLTSAQSGMPTHSHVIRRQNAAVIQGGASFGQTGDTTGTNVGLGTDAVAAANAASSHDNMHPWLCPGYLMIYGG